ncbi:putative amidoligase enzyme-domain-containing protein [Xylariales sp. AK1849]|nr:putative amidoligase enzyme-domain-containing protein [Xylariales sp. AK1849]
MADINVDSRGQRLTFGVELEFMLAYLEPGSEDPAPHNNGDVYITEPLPDFVGLSSNDGAAVGTKTGPRTRFRFQDTEEEGQYHPYGPYLRHRIAKLLRNHNVPAISDSGDRETEDLLRKHRKETAAKLGIHEDLVEQANEESTLWVVDTDTSVGEVSNLQYGYLPVEIKSPVLYYDEESIQLVKHVVNLLVSEYCILSNHSSMLHVHVGRGIGGYSMNDLRMISSVLFAAAPRLDQLHPIHCGPLTEWAPGMRTLSMMANLSEKTAQEAVEKRKGPETINPSDMPANADQKVMTLVDDERLSRFSSPYHDQARSLHTYSSTNGKDTSIETVWADPEAYEAHYRSAYNFRNLMAYPVTKKTIEYRQHVGTMSAVAIENWIRVTAGIIDFCVHAPFLSAINPVLQKLDQPDPNAETSFAMNEPKDRERKVNAAHIFHGKDGDPYSVYDFLWDIGLGPAAKYYEQAGLHPMPPDLTTKIPKSLIRPSRRLPAQDDQPMPNDTTFEGFEDS